MLECETCAGHLLFRLARKERLESGGRALKEKRAPMRLANLHEIRRSGVAFFDNIFAEGTPVLANDFSQSWEEGPRMLPSIKASPGQRVQPPTWLHDEQVVRSFSRIERTSFI